jgi:hypothetical protein
MQCSTRSGDGSTAGGVYDPVFRRAAPAGHLFGGGLRASAIAVGTDPVGAELAQRVGRRLANAGRGAQHHGNLAGQLEELAAVLHVVVWSHVVRNAIK